MDKKRVAVRVGMALLATCIGLWGCGQKAAEKISEAVVEKAIEDAAAREGQKVDVDMSSGRVTIQSEEGTFEMDTGEGSTTFSSDKGEGAFVVGAQAEIPEDFPKDVPLYANMTPNMVMQDNAEKTITVTASTPDAPDKVVAFFRSNMKDKGWSEDTALTGDMGKMNLFTFTKGEREATLMVLAGETGAEITLTVKQE